MQLLSLKDLNNLKSHLYFPAPNSFLCNLAGLRRTGHQELARASNISQGWDGGTSTQSLHLDPFARQKPTSRFPSGNSSSSLLFAAPSVLKAVHFQGGVGDNILLKKRRRKEIIRVMETKPEVWFLQKHVQKENLVL